MAKPKSKRIIFKGWDYTELLPVLLDKTTEQYEKEYEKDEDCFAADEAMVKDMKEAIFILMEEKEFSKSNKIVNKKISYIRKFVKAVADCEKTCGYRYPLIKGLYDIEHDATFLKYTAYLIDSLWT